MFSMDTIVMGAFGLLLLAVGVAMVGSKSFVVRIGSASGEANALLNGDRQCIQKLVDAVSQTIIDRR